MTVAAASAERASASNGHGRVRRSMPLMSLYRRTKEIARVNRAAACIRSRLSRDESRSVESAARSHRSRAACLTLTIGPLGWSCGRCGLKKGDGSSDEEDRQGPRPCELTGTSCRQEGIRRSS